MWGYPVPLLRYVGRFFVRVHRSADIPFIEIKDGKTQFAIVPHNIPMLDFEHLKKIVIEKLACQLKKFLRFKRNKGKYIVPHAITFARILRKLFLDDLQHAFAEFLNGILGCRSLIRLDKEVRRKGEESSFETRYFISCLDPDEVSAKEFQELILGHWEVENCLHGQKDRYLWRGQVCGGAG